MKILTGFAVINSDVGKKIAYTFSEVDEQGNVTKSNLKESFAVLDENVLKAITVIESTINKRFEE
ncbi:hypothetical protein [Clostridium sp. YIM B02555]|uniref:hypothetical protein n=1 Tax=Clostridium sp. YIM B02555 TaxID=2911968 RepID=UPI001EEDF16B|nr:hypothetical protein [Clostridium sp. YIM B02555]